MNQNIFQTAVQFLNMGRDPMAIFRQAAGNDPRIAQGLQMISGKNPAQLKQMAENMAKERGIDLSELARSYGINLPK